MRIFLLENDPLFRKMIKEDLEEEGHEVTLWCCINGAAEEIKIGNYDLLIIDIILPWNDDLPGDECEDGGVRVLQSLVDDGISLPTLFISVEGYEKNKEKIERLKLKIFSEDIPTYFRKPYNEEFFLSAIRNIQHVLKL
jgi:CheY-like chemotaxis protein